MTNTENNKYNGWKEKWERIFYFFPIQLFLLHIKRNHLLLIFWFILFGYVTQSIGKSFGIPYLFLYPEYMGEVNFLSHAILGFSVGGFIMAFNIYSYVLHGYKFRFIATLSRPFFKFTINNFFIPVAFVITYICCASHFQLYKELLNGKQVFFNMAGFFIGQFAFIAFTILYFFKFNKDVIKLGAKNRKGETEEEQHQERLIDATLHKKQKWDSRLMGSNKWRVETYMNSLFHINLARDSGHYDKEILEEVFKQNHINAAIFEFTMIISFLLIGAFRDIEWFSIPAGASIILLLTMAVMIISAIYSWLKGWTLTLLIVSVVTVNYLGTHYEFFKYRNFAYGIDYSSKAEYSLENLYHLSHNAETHDRDKKHALQILNNWRKKNQTSSIVSGKKPKLIVVNVSGGGLRAALWAFQVMDEAENNSMGKFWNQLQFITGSSGGMIGAAYWRELKYQNLTNPSFQWDSEQFKENITKDVLNPVAFAIATNDFLVRYRTFQDGSYIYTRDRGYDFEQQLNKNLNNIFANKRLKDYAAPEFSAAIPMIVMAPSIINDGRRLIVSSQPVSYFSDYTIPGNKDNVPALVENVEFCRLFEKQNATNIRYLSALRMNATFPYIMPMVTLPSSPPIEIMDAGIRDNYGVKTSVQYLKEFRNWIKTNTSGVVFIQIRDTEKEQELENLSSGSLMQRLRTPFSGVSGNVTRIHDLNNEQFIQMAAEWFGSDFHYLTFTLGHAKNDRISLSWHLTNLEKEKIKRSLQEESNKKEMMRLVDLITP